MGRGYFSEEAFEKQETGKSLRRGSPSIARGEILKKEKKSRWDVQLCNSRKAALRSRAREGGVGKLRKGGDHPKVS